MSAKGMPRQLEAAVAANKTFYSTRKNAKRKETKRRATRHLIIGALRVLCLTAFGLAPHAIARWLPVQCRMARAALGLSAKKLAVAARVAPQTIVRFERGDKIRASTSPACVKFSKPLAWSLPTDVSLGFA